MINTDILYIFSYVQQSWAHSTIAATYVFIPAPKPQIWLLSFQKVMNIKLALVPPSPPSRPTTTTTNLHDHHHAPGPLSLCTTLQRPPNPQRPLKEWPQPQWPCTTNHYFYHHHLLYNCKNRVVTFLTQCTKDSSFIAFLLPTSFTFIIWDSVYTL